MSNMSLPFKISLLAAAVSLTACGGDSKGGSSNNAFSGSGINGLAITANGGNSASYEAGNGGEITINKSQSPRALNVLTKGAANTKYKLPAQQANAGSNGVTIAADTEIKLVTTVDDLAAGDLYVTSSRTRLYKFSEGSKLQAQADEVTGLTVNAGATLTLPKNNGSRANLYFANDIVNNGTIKPVATEGESTTPSIRLNAAAYYAQGDIQTMATEP